MPKRQILFIVLILVVTTPAYADGWTFVNGRFPEGPVTVFSLTKKQRALLDLAWQCRDNRNNHRTPYIFKLTYAQSKFLKKQAGISPSRFTIFESYRGDTGADEDINIINRFSENEFEIPQRLLTNDVEAHEWEVNTMGWLPNSLETLNPIYVKPDTCP